MVSTTKLSILLLLLVLAELILQRWVCYISVAVCPFDIFEQLLRRRGIVLFLFLLFLLLLHTRKMIPQR